MYTTVEVKFPAVSEAARLVETTGTEKGQTETKSDLGHRVSPDWHQRKTGT